MYERCNALQANITGWHDAGYTLVPGKHIYAPRIGGQILAALQACDSIEGFDTKLAISGLENHVNYQRAAHEAWRAQNPAIIEHIAKMGTGRF